MRRPINYIDIDNDKYAAFSDLRNTEDWYVIKITDLEAKNIEMFKHGDREADAPDDVMIPAYALIRENISENQSKYFLAEDPILLEFPMNRIKWEIIVSKS